MSSLFRIVLRSGPTPGKTFPLEKGEVFIGRDLSNDIIINDPEISRRHSRLFYQNGAYILEDLGSTNGTSVNGQRLVSPYILQPGETITLGERITLSYEASPQESDATVSAGAQNQAGAVKTVIPSPQNQPVSAYPPAYQPTSYGQPTPPPTRPLQQPDAYPPQQYQPATPPAYQSFEPDAQPQYQAAPYEQASSPFAQQVPMAPDYENDEPRTRMPVWPFIIIGILLLIILVLVIDDFNLWCPLFGMCG